MSATPTGSTGLTEAFGPMERLLQAGLLLLLGLWCFQIVSPFLGTLAWALIVAVSVQPVNRHFEAALAGRRGLAATLTTLLALAVLVVPTAYLGDTMVLAAQRIGRALVDGDIHVPAPPAWVAETPVVGERLDAAWRHAVEDSGAVLEWAKRLLKPVGLWVLSASAGFALGFLQFVVAILIAGVLLAQRERAVAGFDAVLGRIAPQRGEELAELAGTTIRNVSRGVLGVAFIQALAAGLAFLLVGLPAPGLWALLCFILSVVQIGTLPVVGPAAVYVLFTADPLVAVPFTIWCGLVGVIDNFLRPLLLHQGMTVPLWLIVVGSIGGLIASGVIGLFTGPVVLVLGYELVRHWLARPAED